MRMVFGTIQTLMMSCYYGQKENESYLGYQLVFLINWNLLISTLLELF